MEDDTKQVRPLEEQQAAPGRQMLTKPDKEPSLPGEALLATYIQLNALLCTFVPLRFFFSHITAEY